jgi:hypothetical protein
MRLDLSVLRKHSTGGIAKNASKHGNATISGKHCWSPFLAGERIGN